MATYRPRAFEDLQTTAWDTLKFVLHFGWQDTDSAFRNDAGNPGTLQFMRDDDGDGTPHLKIDLTRSDVVAGWEKTRFNFVDGHTLTLGDKFRIWSENSQVGADWALKGEDVIRMMKDPSLKLARIEGLFAEQFRVLGIFLPRSVRQSGGRLTDIFLFTVLFGGSPDGGATGPPPSP